MIFTQRPNFLYGLILLTVGLVGLICILGSWHLERVEIRENELKQMEIDRRVAWEKYFALDLRVPLDEVKALPLEDHVLVAGVDLTLHNAVQNIQNNSFDSIYIDNVRREAFINIFAPQSLKPADLESFMFFQALNYSTILKRLYPNIDLHHIGIRVYTRGGALKGFMSYKGLYNFSKMLNLKRFGYIKAYYIEKDANKKATTQ